MPHNCDSLIFFYFMPYIKTYIIIEPYIIDQVITA